MAYNSALSFVFGSLIKSYDDIYDNEVFHKLFSDISIELIKTFTICVYTLISTNNFNVPFVILISHILLYMIDKESLNNPFFVSGMLITLFLCIYTFNKESFNLRGSMFSILAMIVCLWVDHIMFPEESSIKKIIGRIVLLGIAVVLFYNFSEYFIKDMVFFCMGYLTTSIVNMSLSEFKGKDTTDTDKVVKDNEQIKSEKVNES